MSIAEKLEKIITGSGLSEAEFWALVSAHHYAELVVRNRDHQLVFVHGQIDFGELAAACGAYRQYAGERGQAETHTVEQLCRALIVKRLEGWNFRFRAAQCADCPLFAQCRGPKGKPGTRRQVFISDYRYTQLTALAYTKTPEFAEDMKLRSNIERVIAGVVRYNDGRYARGCGLANADYPRKCKRRGPVKMAAMSYNLKRWHKIALEQEKALRYKPPPSLVLDGD